MNPLCWEQGALRPALLRYVLEGGCCVEIGALEVALCGAPFLRAGVDSGAAEVPLYAVAVVAWPHSRRVLLCDVDATTAALYAASCWDNALDSGGLPGPVLIFPPRTAQERSTGVR